ncbi:MAG TPA: hypothetical protein VMX16_03855 [Terriglobia bacterium]|nr:hypothetical protein [Terriglobia bacterium]
MENWVKLRHDCSPFVIFTKLRLGAEEDVKTRNELKKPEEKVSFKLVANGDRFAVLREGTSGAYASVVFKCTESEISAHPEAGQSHQRASADPLRATLTLTNEGDCKLKTDKEELTCWQFRKKVLEDLFFNF